MSRKIRKAIVARCAECESRIYFNTEPEIGTVVTCKECGTKLEVIELNPIELDWVYDDYYERAYDDYDEYDL
jgi:lysine biosynthesis protein LysW